ncbi:TPA: Cof-type HAD-IIB family hydrolase [Mannheimia haemolytica]
MQTQPYKAIFSDIDGTLLNSRHQITPKTEKAIKAVIQQGIPFIPVSARPPLAITPYANQLNLTNPIICYSGALVLDHDLTPLCSIAIEPDDLIKLEQHLKEVDHLSISHYAGTRWFCNRVEDQWIQQESEITGLTASQKPAVVADVHKILIMGTAEQIASLEQQLKAEFPQLSIHRSKNEYLEIMNKAATKSNAIRFMEKRLNITGDEVIAFGDNFNDLDMLEYAGLSVAMGNSPQPIKQAAKRVTVTNDEDGIALVLEEVFAL